MAIMNTVIKGGGVQPSGTKPITSNGIHDVAGYANADVQVPTTAPDYYITKGKDANNKLVVGSTVIDLTGVTDIGNYALPYAYAYNNNITGTITNLSYLTTISGNYACHRMFYYCSGVTSVDLSSLTTISGGNACAEMFMYSRVTSVDLSSLTTISGDSACYSMFQYSGVTSVDLSSLTTVSGGYACNSMFSGCTGITSVDLRNLKSIKNGSSITQRMFQNCTGITSIDLSSLEEINYSNWPAPDTFSGCSSLTSATFPSLKIVIGNHAMEKFFQNCTSLTTIRFPALTTSFYGSYTNPFTNMVSGVTGCTVHFPMALQSVIGSWTDIVNGLGGTNTVILFDIVSEITGADSITYTRKEKDATATAMAWVYNDTLYYTLGLEPSVGDTIYSDSACTQVVTTVSAIA